MNFNQLAPGIFAVDAFLASSECEALIRRAKTHGFEKTTIATAGSHKVEPNIRNNDRVIIDDHQLAGDYWTRIAEFTPGYRRGA